MPTIKTKKEMNKKEYAQFLKDNAEIIEITAGYKDIEKYVLNIKLEPLNNKTTAISKDILEVEIEEEITEDTVIPKSLIIFKSNPLKIQDDRGNQRAFVHNSESIQFILNKAKSQRENIDTIHIINDDNTHTLIWKNGKLVEQ